MISGARYSGVPQSVQVRPFTLFAKPKSVTWERELSMLMKVHWVTNYHSRLRTYLYVTLLVNKKVLRLQISIDEIQRVEVFKGQYNLGCVKAGVWFTTNKSHNTHAQLTGKITIENKTYTQWSPLTWIYRSALNARTFPPQEHTPLPYRDYCYPAERD